MLKFFMEKYTGTIDQTSFWRPQHHLNHVIRGDSNSTGRAQQSTIEAHSLFFPQSSEKPEAITSSQ